MEHIFPGEFKEAHYFVMTWNNLLGRGFLVHCGIVLFCWGFFSGNWFDIKYKRPSKTAPKKTSPIKMSSNISLFGGFSPSAKSNAAECSYRNNKITNSKTFSFPHTSYANCSTLNSWNTEDLNLFVIINNASLSTESKKSCCHSAVTLWLPT